MRPPEGHRLILYVAAFLLLMAALHLTAEREHVTGLEAFLADRLAPLQRGLATVGAWTAKNWQALLEWRQLKEINAKLRAQVELLQTENIRLREYRRENAWLREALGFRQEVGYNMLPAQVIARDPGNWLSSIIIDLGEEDGLRAGMGVVGPGGVVGSTRSVAKKTARVMLMIDPSSAIGGVSQRTGDLVLVEGLSESAGLARVKPLVRDADLKQGDIIVTSGLSVIFPKGLPIGRLVTV
ncbi:MAG: rod shape-determining protein MreC, partial [Firmicutes bacterium]|nr:rod shape-determining protein MreC [Bacillota bacterium]